MNCHPNPLLIKYNDILSCDFTSNYSRSATFSVNLANSVSRSITCNFFKVDFP